VAARLQALSQVDSVLISATTFRLCAKNFNAYLWVPMRSRVSRNPWKCSRCWANSRKRWWAGRRGTTPQIGRERETGVLTECWG